MAAYGRRLDWFTLLVQIRLRIDSDDEEAATIRLTKRGFTSWWGFIEPDMDEAKWFATDDAAALALLAGESKVPGVDD